MRKNILTHKSASVSSKGSSPPLAKPAATSQESENTAKSPRKHGSYKIRRKRVRRIELAAESPLKQVKQSAYNEESSETDDAEDIIWGSPSKKHILSDDQAYIELLFMKPSEYNVKEEMHSVLMVNRNRQMENNSLGLHDAYASIPNTDTDLSLTQQMQTIQDQSLSILDSSLPPLIETPKRVRRTAYLFTPLSSTLQNPSTDVSTIQEPAECTLPSSLMSNSPSLVRRGSDAAFDSLLDDSILEEADRIEKEVLSSR